MTFNILWLPSRAFVGKMAWFAALVTLFLHREGFQMHTSFIPHLNSAWEWKPPSTAAIPIPPMEMGMEKFLYPILLISLLLHSKFLI
jgi:hypothetical protein